MVPRTEIFFFTAHENFRFFVTDRYGTKNFNFYRFHTRNFPVLWYRPVSTGWWQQTEDWKTIIPYPLVHWYGCYACHSLQRTIAIFLLYTYSLHKTSRCTRLVNCSRFSSACFATLLSAMYMCLRRRLVWKPKRLLPWSIGQRSPVTSYVRREDGATFLKVRRVSSLRLPSTNAVNHLLVIAFGRKECWWGGSSQHGSFDMVKFFVGLPWSLWSTQGRFRQVKVRHWTSWGFKWQRRYRAWKTEAISKLC